MNWDNPGLEAVIRSGAPNMYTPFSNTHEKGSHARI